jgi:procollagen-lysine,2-oxoglutarate 5-dioxygenase
MGEEWKGGNMLSVGGGFKVNLLKKEVEKLKDEKNLVIMFSDR